ncbi:LPS biosynthesis glycosyltransferase [Tardiphaga robiniae]|uniref:LPS biosynthesis glycosyltransferase n=1 Tax=Tardiphaga robiniae TaxID=943830 RepID=A0A7G6TUN2_9BRAD|nr:LPS biosynthesis glycosyltransferase [Tardiphaga robiniae]QND70464.1 LPS biosynthesis glycosyltransferase [Tardiphaga robiniae]
MTASFFPAIKPAELQGFPSIGAHGCFMSHLAVLKEGQRCHQHVMIIEDDLDFVDDFQSRWGDIFADLEAQPWSIFYPAHFIETLPAGISEVAPGTGVMCTHFMMFHRDAVAEIIGGLELMLQRPPGHSDGGPMHVDGAYSTLRAQRPSLRTFAYSPALGTQRSSRSDIADLKFYDRMAALRPTARIFRELKRSLGL